MKLLEDILGDMAGATAAIVRQAQEFKRLETAIEQVLDIRVKVSNIRHDTLYLQVPSAAQATQLQYRQYPFLSKLQHEGLIPNVRTLKVQVRPDTKTANRVARQPAKISSDNQSLLQAHAATTDFPALKLALLKLSQR
ncbi:MAG: DciA family protein [Pseudomonadales bacterium]|nr:DciA family protein [Pseudomonadales bacterium]